MKKKVKDKSVSTPAANQDIVGLLTTLVQKLTSFETKLDTVLSRLPLQPHAVPRQQPTPPPIRHEQRREHRHMHKAVCADCGRDCEVPFKPSSDRPVYCKECFTTRKKNGTFKPYTNGRPKQEPPPHVKPPETPKAAKPAKPVKKKKPAAKKKGKRK